jgi:hypothetical protein
MKIASYIIAICMFGLSNFSNVKANPIYSAELVYEYVTGNTYRLFVRTKVDCKSSGLPYIVSACYTDDCQNSYPIVFRDSAFELKGIPQIVPCHNFSTTCYGGVLNDYRIWTYSTVLNLDTTCNVGSFSVVLSPRTNIVNLLEQDKNVYLNAKINLKAKNSSVTFNDGAILYTCKNTTGFYNSGIRDLNNDAIITSNILPQTAQDCYTPQNLAFAQSNVSDSPYHLTTNPIQSNNTYILDSNTSVYRFIMGGSEGYYALGFQFDEYRNGVWVGSSQREVLIYSYQCPSFDVGLIYDPQNSNHVNVVNDTFYVCAGQAIDLCHRLEVYDTLAVIKNSQDNSRSLTGKELFTYQPIDTNDYIACLNWVPSALDSGLKVFNLELDICNARLFGLNLRITKQIVVVVSPITQIFGKDSICFGDSVYLEAYGGSQFNWTVVSGDSASLSCPQCPGQWVAPIQNTRYTVSSNLTNMCSVNVDTFDVTMRAPTVIQVSNDTAVCIGITVLLQPNHDTMTNVVYHYEWKNSNGQVLSTDSSWTVQPDSTNTYVVTVWSDDDKDCPATDTVTVTVFPTWQSNLSDEFDICRGDSVILNLWTSQVVKYQWTSNVATPNVQMPIVSPNTTTVYTVLMFDDNGCSQSLQTMVNVYDVPTITLTDSVVLYPNEAYQVEGESDGWYFQWYPNDGVSDSQILNPVLNPEDTKWYYVEVSTKPFCLVTDSILVKRMHEPIMDIPNAITPGSGDQNAVFKPILRGISEVKAFYIFNRWGNKVFDGTKMGLDAAWNGYDGAQRQPTGVYMYYIELIDAKGKTIVKKGNLTLVN